MDQNLLERVNPVFNTAKMTVFQLASSGVKEAALVAEKLNLSFEETQNSASVTVAPEQMTANTIRSALRLHAARQSVLTKGYRLLRHGSSRRDRRG
nr:hypothetical protein [uncultured Ruminococcus sp.]